MAITINNLKNYLSGGSSNVTPGASLGGAIGTQTNSLIKSQTASTPVNITGVVIKDAFGNPEGVGGLSFVKATNTMAWKPYGQTTYYGVPTSTDGEYLIGNSAGYMIVQVTAASLPASDKVDSITIANQQQNLFDTVTAANSLIGKTSYRCIYIKNTHGTDAAAGVTVWVKNVTAAGDDITIGLGTSANGGTEQTISDEITAPSGVTFSQPLTYGSGLSIGTLNAGSWKALWLRRIVPAATRGTVISNNTVISIAASI